MYISGDCHLPFLKPPFVGQVAGSKKLSSCTVVVCCLNAAQTVFFAKAGHSKFSQRRIEWTNKMSRLPAKASKPHHLRFLKMFLKQIPFHLFLNIIFPLENCWTWFGKRYKAQNTSKPRRNWIHILRNALQKGLSCIKGKPRALVS